MQALFVVFVAVAAACALTAIVAARRCAVLQQEISRVCTALSNERGRVAAHDAELDQITETLRKLSGRIGAVRKEAKNSVSDLGAVDDSRLTWKQEMREKLGIVPTVRR